MTQGSASALPWPAVDGERSVCSGDRMSKRRRTAGHRGPIMRQPVIAGNWKMFKTVHEAVVHVKELRSLTKDVVGGEIVVAPPFTALHAVVEAARNSNIAVAGQNCHWEREGAYTGEVSARMVREAGAEYVIIGHSERRALFGETDETVNRRTRAALAEGLVPIVCVGETLEQRDAGQTLAVVDQQVQRGLDGVTADQVAAMVLAYEPVWAIGTGRNATPAQAGEVHGHIRMRLRSWWGVPAAEGCHVIYGGSVKPGNIAELRAVPDIDGALVGGASLDVGDFTKIVRLGVAAAGAARR
jgi:triosephosphate isomerase